MAKEKVGDFADYKNDALTKPRDMAWSNWKSWEPPKVGDKVQGYIRDAFYRPAEGLFKDQRGITLKQTDGTLINVGIKRLPFILDKTDNLRIGDPLTIELVELKKSSTKGFNATNIFAFFGKNLPENAGNKTVLELDNEDQKRGGSTPPESEADKEFDGVDTDKPPVLSSDKPEA